MDKSRWFILFLVLTIFYKNSFSQEFDYGFGLNFSPAEVVSSTNIITVSKNIFLEKIVDYFYNFDSQTVSDEQSIRKKEFFEEVMLMSKLGFGTREIIRIILIYKKVPITNKKIRPIAELCLKNKSIKTVAEKFRLNYETNIWLESNRIYEKLLQEEY